MISLERRLGWELTKRCDRRCAHCVSALYHERLPDELDPGAALAVVGRCRQGGVGQVHLLGGEPTVREDLPALLEALDEAGIGTVLTTSGSRLGLELVRTLATLRRLRAVCVSFEDVREAAADEIRGPGSFAAAREAVRRLRHALPGLAVVVSFTVNRPALEALEPFEILSWFAALGASRVVFQDLAVPSAAPPSLVRLALDGPLWLEFVCRLHRPGLRAPLPFDYPLKPLVAEHVNRRVGSALPVGPYHCQGVRRELRLLPDGTVLPCSAAVGWPGALDASLADGRRLPASSLEEVLAGPLFARFLDRRDRAEGDPMMEPCRSCHLAYHACRPCVFGQLEGEERRVQTCSWAAEAAARDGCGRGSGLGSGGGVPGAR